MLSSSGANTNGKKTVQAAPALSINNTGGPGVDLAVSSLNLDSSERSAPSMQSLRQKRQQLLAKLKASEELMRTYDRIGQAAEKDDEDYGVEESKVQ